ncbi:hypothetical protein QWV57_07075 [Geobacillus zalihae]|uniref:Zorya protein ZorC EH domain-containing protein n=1 Tax=Geobacillus zalihae TaxID=213419 RepID=A0A7H1RWL9_9BACL|nr:MULTISPECIES: hypothetical protein [Geobacillus]EPR27899.1 hypothetical protein I656_02416 [Geobacillus sp. WSUCF1]OQP24526.1 hypothetical protein B1694_03750 [Geobacillus zalihae]QNU18658.1 hypothetical protein IC807_02965 [Geobacillus zalihae]WKA48706.1 hypothetical protein QWV57_07075 [Geobacillus zalihae]
MKYEYEPVLLKRWLREVRPPLLEKTMENSNEKYRGLLERLSDQFAGLVDAPSSAFEQWVKQLSRREKLLLPNLYKKELPEEMKKAMIDVIQQHVRHERRLFRVLVDVVYETCDLDEIWKLLRYAYASHIEKIEKRMEKEKSEKWRRYLSSKDPIVYLATTAYESEKGILEELETFYLTKNFPLFKLVLMEIFQLADESFFLKEQELYRDMFVSSTNEQQQKMANALIKKCKLNHVKPLGRLIFEKLQTYHRKPMLWRYVGEEEKQRFAQWIMRLELKDFFGGVNKNHERFQYWEKFIPKLEDVVVTDERTTLIMYFHDVVIMEVLGTGAVYIYRADVFRRHFQPKIDRMLAEREQFANKAWRKVREVKRTELMDRDLTIPGGWLRHNGGWQWKFDEWLRRELGWEVRRDVLLQKETENDEGSFDAE